MNSPRYKSCDICGRNEHKVAIRASHSGGRSSEGSKVTGICPSCIEGYELAEGTEVIYDRRAERTRKAHPILFKQPKVEAPSDDPTETVLHTDGDYRVISRGGSVVYIYQSKWYVGSTTTVEEAVRIIADRKARFS